MELQIFYANSKTSNYKPPTLLSVYFFQYFVCFKVFLAAYVRYLMFILIFKYEYDVTLYCFERCKQFIIITINFHKYPSYAFPTN